MSTFVLVLSVIAAIIVLFLLAGALMKKDHQTHREIIISAPRQEVFDYLKHIRNQDNFNKWVMTDPGMQKKFSGNDGAVGFVYAWSGNKAAGEGEQEITSIDEGKSITMEIRFVRPFAGIAKAKMTTESVGDNQTRTSWNTESFMKYPINVMLPMIVKMLEKDMDSSLTTLKHILEKK